MNMYQINLNLLVAFDVLMQEQNVTRASQKLNISQSATSNALKRLRELFKDELLLKTPSGMEPTKMALELVEPVREVIERAKLIFSEAETFDVAKTERVFRIGMSDYAAMVMLPVLQKHLEANAPGIHLDIRSLNLLTNSTRLDSDEIELAIGFYDNLPEKLYKQVIFHEHGVFAGWNENPLMQSKLTMQKLLQAKHIGIQYSEMGSTLLLDEYLTAQGYEARNIAISVPYAILGLLLLPQTNYLIITGKRFAKLYQEILPISYQEPPLELPSAEFCQVWHARHHNDQGLMWLRSLVKKLYQD